MILYGTVAYGAAAHNTKQSRINKADFIIVIRQVRAAAKLQASA